MFKDTVSDNAKFWRYFGILMVCGFMLFILGAVFYERFRALVIALDTTESVPLMEWLMSGGAALLIGSFWLSIYLVFEAAKKGIIDLMHKN